MRKIFIAILIVFLFTQSCFAGPSAKKEVKKGNLLYNKGKFEEALKNYEEALIDAPDSDIVNFNLGAALYKTEDYQAALNHFEKSLLTEDESLEAKAHYNLGNTKYKYANAVEDTNPSQAVSLLKQALRHYERSLEINPEDEDALHNYEITEEELKKVEEKLKLPIPGLQKDNKYEDEDAKSQEGDREGEETGVQKDEKDGKDAVESESAEKEVYEKDDEGDKKIGSAEQTEEEEAGKTPGYKKSSDEMSEKEALMILDGYRQEEEPKILYRPRIDTRQLPGVEKDW